MFLSSVVATGLAMMERAAPYRDMMDVSTLVDASEVCWVVGIDDAGASTNGTVRMDYDRQKDAVVLAADDACGHYVCQRRSSRTSSPDEKHVAQ
ncbi:hypothetical protein PF005_g15876 [Phytophthora fragariae]|uniref:Uncharacterized protein n=1 Tax=Phytophthora fragariae TaxID=53985 RepID=A0A6A3XCE7_9STRA|nr:hypothetical protein PF003_g3441 [Phytophthora fragariae]KAE8938354.1 hypothetical protein PF009_g11761 [Phytophthora fragariae]KAE8999357.1 hypothetical protein PF011_g14659 [Phytophthora fragariae]KAE9098398.1 hypothetical protein PF010_g15578 [Phytophthora fragariae]KAE9111694.1 hypothetical protein PF007_g11383 [Phytophthora fragariae]